MVELTFHIIVRMFSDFPTIVDKSPEALSYRTLACRSRAKHESGITNQAYLIDLSPLWCERPSNPPIMSLQHVEELRKRGIEVGDIVVEASNLRSKIEV